MIIPTYLTQNQIKIIYILLYIYIIQSQNSQKKILKTLVQNKCIEIYLLQPLWATNKL